MPKVSVGLPVYNGETFVDEALKSIMNQTFEDFELIISDNASTDKTEEICRSYAADDERVRYYRNDVNLGAAYNFNRVFELSTGKYFKWMAHDDLCAPTFLEKCVSVLDLDPSVILAFSKTKFIDESGEFLHDYNYRFRINASRPSRHFFDLIVANHIVVEIFGLIRSEVLRQTPLIGKYVGSDRVLLGELALRGRFFEIPEFIFYHREHPQRSTKMFPSLHERAAWFDSAKANRMVYPTWRLFAEHLASIGRVQPSLPERLGCYFQMIKWIRAKRLYMMGDLMIALRQRLSAQKEIKQS